MPIDEAKIAKMVNYSPPAFPKYARQFRSMIRYFDPQYHGMENVEQDKPTLFVANHSLMSVADFLIAYGLYKHTGHYPRALGDRMHFSWASPQRKLMTDLGIVIGDRDVMRALMADKQSIIVFPGGAREVLKRKDEKYKLIWKQRVGFVRLALEGKYSITPIGVSGGDEVFNILFDSSDFLKSPIGRLARKSSTFRQKLRGGEEMPPIMRGMGLSMIPKPQQLHFVAGKPLKLTKYRKLIDDKEAMLEAREKVASSIYKLIDKAHNYRRTARKNTSRIRRIASSI